MKKSVLAARSALASAAIVLTWGPVGCSSPEETLPANDGGTSTGGTGATAGAAGVAPGGGSGGSGLGGTGGTGAGGAGAANGGAGGFAGGGAGSGGSGQAGSTAGDGGTGMGGQSGAGMGGMSGAGAAGMSGAGGAGAGGAGGSAGGGAGGGGGKAPADPSTGCGKSSPQLGSSQSPLTVSGHQYYVKLPPGYDASQPYPVLFMFNPTNNPISWAETAAGFETNGARDAWIRVYPHPANSGSGWGSGDVSFFQPLYDSITSSFCVDRARVFASGESSGGDFSSILGCEHANKLRGIAPCATKPVGPYPLEPARRTCTGQVSSIVIHGIDDSVVGPENGPLTRDFYRALNHCTSMSMPVTGYTNALSNCVLFQGCDDGYPVYWCQHDDPEYSGTSHGWPAFAENFIFEIFSAY